LAVLKTIYWPREGYIQYIAIFLPKDIISLQAYSTHLEPAQLSSAQKNQIGCQLSSTVELGVKCQLKEPYAT